MFGHFSYLIKPSSNAVYYTVCTAIYPKHHFELKTRVKSNAAPFGSSTWQAIWQAI